jgi:hypothetical protein
MYRQGLKIFIQKRNINALVELKKQNPSLRKAVVELNDGFSGDGNAIFLMTA